jgi:quercetin dioxygenase-like cupin family protein
MSIIPEEISAYFQPQNFINYPTVSVPQEFEDSRGKILNIADGVLGDVSVINSKKGAIRANHVHKDDWHLCYLIEGEITYYWKEDIGSLDQNQRRITPGEMIYTPPQTPHKLVFNEASIFITISRLSRLIDKYESDTRRLDDEYFKE